MSSVPSIPPLLATPQAQPQLARVQQRRAQGQRRGAPTRGRGGAQFWAQQSQTATRGGSNFGQRGRGWRGGFRGQ